MNAIAVLWRRELVRFFRQKSRVVGALAQPLLFWLLFGSGLSGTFNAGGVGYAQYFTGVPVGLVAIHLLGSVCVWIAVLTFELGLHTHPAEADAGADPTSDAPEPAAAALG